MTNEVKAIILCNNPIAIPAIREFLFFNKVAAFIIPRKNREMTELLTEMTAGTDAKIITVDRKDVNPVTIAAIEEHGATVGLVMTFPYILSPALLAKPAKGFVNFHYGLLPQCRGPHPIFWHIRNNDTEAGITIHRMDEGVDTGPVIQQLKVPVTLADTYGILQSKLAFEGAKAAANLLKILSYGSIIPAVPQDETKAAYYAKPQAGDVTIQFSTMTAETIIRMVNACNPWNKAAAANIGNWRVGVTAAEFKDMAATPDTPPGTIIHLNANDGCCVQTIDSKVLLLSVIYLQEGFFPGWKLADFGIKQGELIS